MTRSAGMLPVVVSITSPRDDMRRTVPSALSPRGAPGHLRLHFASLGEEALDKLAAGIEPQLIVILSDIKYAGHGRIGVVAPDQDAAA
jgi:hypothetical protein